MGYDPKHDSQCMDQLLLRFMDQLEALDGKREKLNSLIEQGWFFISKARYSMGNKQVSTLQYASEMEPQVYIHARTVESGVVEFDAERTEGLTGELKTFADGIEDIGPKEEGLRRRTHAKQKMKKEETEQEQLETESKSTSEKETQRNTKKEPQLQDPLKWFGILVPHNLKQAQSVFKEVITLSAEIAALQSAVLVTKTEMHTRMKEKKEKLCTDSIKN